MVRTVTSNIVMRKVFAGVLCLVWVVGLSSCNAIRPSATQGQPKTEMVGPPASAQPALPVGEYPVLIESEPLGATVVVNNIPIGKTPQRVVLPGTPRGFFRDQVSLKVRFVAADATQSSSTIEELMTPLDRIPAVVKFTPAGANRVSRSTARLD